MSRELKFEQNPSPKDVSFSHGTNMKTYYSTTNQAIRNHPNYIVDLIILTCTCKQHHMIL